MNILVFAEINKATNRAVEKIQEDQYLMNNDGAKPPSAVSVRDLALSSDLKANRKATGTHCLMTSWRQAVRFHQSCRRSIPPEL